MPLSQFNGGFKDGISVRGLPIAITHPGKIFWVSNSTALLPNQKTGSDGNDGSFNAPFATLDYAVGQCTANRGDIIFIKPGHTETISTSTALALDVAGIAIIGLGQGTLRPTFTLDTATSATITVSAANIAIKNVLFIANFAAIVALFTQTAKDFTLDTCEVRDTATNLDFKYVVSQSSTTNAADGLWIENCLMFKPGTTASGCMVNAAGTQTRMTIKGNYFTGNCVTDAAKVLAIATGKVITNLIMQKNIFNTVGVTSATGGTIITTDGSTNSGVICENFIQNLDATSEILCTASSGFIFFNNYSSAVADKSGYLLPAADA